MTDEADSAGQSTKKGDGSAISFCNSGRTRAGRSWRGFQASQHYYRAVAFRFEWTDSSFRVVLSRWDRICSFRRIVEIDRANIAKAAFVQRHELESRIDHRLNGVGSHFGWGFPGRRRVGSFLVRDVIGPQFWATARSGPELPLLVLDLIDHKFTRAVLAVSDLDLIDSFLASGTSAVRDS